MKKIAWGIPWLVIMGVWVLLCTHAGPRPWAGVTGSDRIAWEDSERGVVAAQVHPLVRHSRVLSERVMPGDMLRQIDYREVYRAEDVHRMASSASPETVFIYSIERPNPATLAIQSLNVFVRTGYRFSFGYNASSFWWPAGAWASGVTLFAAFLVLLILLPLMRTNIRQYTPLVLLLGSSLLLSALWLVRHFTVSLANDPTNPTFEHIFAPLYGLLLLVNAGAYLWQKGIGARTLLLVLPCILPLLLHMAPLPASFPEDMLYGLCQLLLIVPLVDASLVQLQFGKVSLVVTQTLGFTVLFALGVVLYVAVSQAVEALLPASPYAPLLIASTFIAIAMAARFVYTANIGTFRRYFTSAREARTERLRAFISRIPQYTDAGQLIHDVASEVGVYAQVEKVHLPPAIEWAEISDLLRKQNGFWAANKVFSPTTLPSAWESVMDEGGYVMAFAIQPGDAPGYLLLLGRKRRGVYNVGDVEVFSQLAQQMRLTLSVVALLTRQRDLLQQTYEANLTALRAQINPHFLFNTLNTISALIHDAPEEAEAATEKLAFIFRYTLSRSSQDFVPLDDELSLVRTYLEIEQIRFGKRLSVQMVATPEASKMAVPAFMIQTFAENAIKHGIAKVVQRGEVHIGAVVADGYLACTVTDNGPGIDVSRVRSSTGLRNCLDRLSTLYHRTDLLSFENTGTGTCVVLRIPLQPEPRP